jgi:transcriptional regulator
MYIPPYYKEIDAEKLLAFMQAHSFATLISTHNNNIRATHLPFVIEKREERIFLVTHMAKANPQWQEFGDPELLVIFQGPHAYISPDNYEKKQNVPTWNYIAVHAYGKATLIEDDEGSRAVLEKMIGTYEAKFQSQWKELDQNYVAGMLKGIVSFEIEVTKLEGKFKLSQNKTRNEQQNIITSLGNSHDSLEQEISSEMKKKLEP